MSRKLPNDELTYSTDHTFLFYDKKSNHVVLSTNEHADYIPFIVKQQEFNKANRITCVPQNSLSLIFATNAEGYEYEQQETIMKIKEELIGQTDLSLAPAMISEKFLFEIIDCFQSTITSEQVNFLITNQIENHEIN